MRNEIPLEIDTDAIGEELVELSDLADRTRYAGFGLAMPILRMRQSQMSREHARAIERFGADHPRVKELEIREEWIAKRRSCFESEADRARIRKPVLVAEDRAGVRFRVSRLGKPVEDATVTFWSGTKPVAVTRTGVTGGVGIDLPAETPVTVSVREPTGEEVFVDAEATTFERGEQAFREVDLGKSEPPPPDPGEQPEDEVVAMPDLVGRKEREARRLLEALGLTRVETTTREVAQDPGRVEAQEPDPGTEVVPPGPVSVVIGIPARVEVPDLVGLGLEDARRLLAKRELELGGVETIRAPGAEPGVVASQKPEAGTPTKRGEKVGVQVGAEAGNMEDKLVRIVERGEELLREDADFKDRPEGWLKKAMLRGSVLNVEEVERLDFRNDLDRRRLGVRKVRDTERVLEALKKARTEIGG